MKVIKKLALLSLVLSTPLTFAASGNIKILGRFDYVSEDRDLANTSEPKHQEFRANNAYVIYSGAANEDLDYYFRFNFTGDGSKDTTQNVNTLMEYAYITYKLNKNVDIMGGRQFFWYGGMEEDYNSANVYHYSLAGNGTTGLTTPFYEMGINVATKFAGQTLYWQVFNADKATTNGNKSQRNLSYGLTYYGNLMGGKIVPIFSYHVLPRALDNGAKETYLVLGGRFNITKSIYLDLDWYSLSGDKTNAGKDVDVTSIIAKTGYHFGKNHVALKVVKDKLENDGKETYSEMAYALSYERTINDNIRWHAAYVMQDRDYSSTSSNKDAEFSKIIIGTKFDVDVL